MVEVLNNILQRFVQQMLKSKRNILAVTIFCKMLIVFVMLKIILIWSISITINNLHEFIPSSSFVVRILFSPANWASEHLSIFYSIALMFLTIALFVRWNYILGFLFFLLTLNLYRINIPIVNGSDYVLLMVSFWAIGMSMWPVKNEKWNTVLSLIFNVSVFLCQLQLVFIYLASGWDKLLSEVWRSGEAMDYVAHLDFLFNRYWFGSFDNPFLNLTLSWMTILVELLFVVLVWFKRTRLMMLFIGFVFHLIIGFMLSLPDFALIMIISYMIFLKDSDYNSVRKIFMLKPI